VEEIYQKNKDKGKKPALRHKIILPRDQHPCGHRPMIPQTKTDSHPDWNPEARNRHEESDHERNSAKAAGIKWEQVWSQHNEKIGPVREDISTIISNRDPVHAPPAQTDEQRMRQLMSKDVNAGRQPEQECEHHPKNQSPETKVERTFHEQHALIQSANEFPDTGKKRRQSRQEKQGD